MPVPPVLASALNIVFGLSLAQAAPPRYVAHRSPEPGSAAGTRVDDATLDGTLRRVTHRSGCGAAVVSLGTAFMGIAAGLCGAFRVAPET